MSCWESARAPDLELYFECHSCANGGNLITCSSMPAISLVCLRASMPNSHSLIRQSQ